MVQLAQVGGVRDHNLKVLIVDDTVTMRAMSHGILAHSRGHELVGVAKDTREALALVKSTAPDIVVIDLGMPYIGGSELLSMLSAFPRVRTVILSAGATASGPIRQRLTELGAAAFFDRSEVAANPQAFQNELQRIANCENASAQPHRPAVDPQSLSNVIFAADRFPIPRDEQARLRTLAAMNIANLSIDPNLDIIVRHIAKMIDYPYIAVNLIDADKVWAKAAIGFERQAFQRDESFCTHVLCGEGPMIVSDARTHPLFRALPAVTGGLQIRAYVGAPIVSKDGITLGVVCASDRRTRCASQAEVTKLTDAAKLIAAFLEDAPLRKAA